MGGRCVAGASTTDLKKLSSGDGDARPRGMSTLSSENDRGDDPAADGARGDDCADREPCELSLSLRGEFVVGPAPELSEAARGDDWALSEASSVGSRLMRTTGGRRRRRVLASSAVDIVALPAMAVDVGCELRVKGCCSCLSRLDQPLVQIGFRQACGSAQGLRHAR